MKSIKNKMTNLKFENIKMLLNILFIREISQSMKQSANNSGNFAWYGIFTGLYSHVIMFEILTVISIAIVFYFKNKIVFLSTMLLLVSVAIKTYMYLEKWNLFDLLYDRKSKV